MVSGARWPLTLTSSNLWGQKGGSHSIPDAPAPVRLFGIHAHNLFGLRIAVAHLKQELALVYSRGIRQKVALLFDEAVAVPASYPGAEIGGQGFQLPESFVLGSGNVGEEEKNVGERPHRPHDQEKHVEGNHGAQCVQGRGEEQAPGGSDEDTNRLRSP